MLFDDLEFAVVDVETTGFYPERYDRVLEIAVIRFYGEGQRQRGHVTLINPPRSWDRRHCGLREKHNISFS